MATTGKLFSMVNHSASAAVEDAAEDDDTHLRYMQQRRSRIMQLAGQFHSRTGGFKMTFDDAMPSTPKAHSDDDDDDDDDAVDPELGEIKHRAAPKTMRKLLAAPAVPVMSVAPDRTAVLLQYKRTYLGAQDMTAPEVILAGLEINKQAFGVARTSHAHRITLVELEDLVAEDEASASDSDPDQRPQGPGAPGDDKHGKGSNKVPIDGDDPKGTAAKKGVMRGSGAPKSTPQGKSLPEGSSNPARPSPLPSPLHSFSGSERQKEILGLPPKYDITHVRWSPDSQFCALMVRPRQGVDECPVFQLWMLQRSSRKAWQVSPLALHSVVDPKHCVIWGPDSRTVFYRVVPHPRLPIPKAPRLGGPIIQECTTFGAPAPVRTIPDLLRTNHDMELFEYFTTAQVAVSHIRHGRQWKSASLPPATSMPQGSTFTDVRKLTRSAAQWHQRLGNRSTVTTTLLPLIKAMKSLQLSPDGNFILVDEYEQPYSCAVKHDRFAHTYTVYRVCNTNDVNERALTADPAPAAGAGTGQLPPTPLRPTVRKLRVLARISGSERLSVAYDSVDAGPRNMKWRPNKPHSLFWCEALDGGDSKQASVVRDALFLLEYPFKATPQLLCVLPGRMAGVDYKGRRLTRYATHWSPPPPDMLYRSGNHQGQDGSSRSAPAEFVIVQSMWRKTRNLTVLLVDLSSSEVADESVAPIPTVTVLSDTSYEDRYSEFGLPMMQPCSVYPNQWVVQLSVKGDAVFLKTEGASPEGDRPRVDEYNMIDKTRHIVWQSRPRLYEVGMRLLEIQVNEDGSRTSSLLVCSESQTSPPNYMMVTTTSQVTEAPSVEEYQIRPITELEHPYPKLKAVTRVALRYKRDDGVELSADMYLPPGYSSAQERGKNAANTPRLPCLVWAYPTEFLSPVHAGQNRSSPNRFLKLTKPALFLLCEGYVVLDNVSVPIVAATPGAEPNDTFIQQLKTSLRAAVDEVVRIGVADRDRMAVAGHSYGAFMAANIVAHMPDLFQCAVLRSGAFNRTLTPFGFQREERLLWEAPHLYMQISPFVHAHNIQTPVLIIHGASDQNPGTRPIQSEMLFAALKGLGKVVRYVSLPNARHAYKGKANVAHVLWEMANWLNMHLAVAE